MNGLRLYARMIGVSLRSQLQYRVTFALVMLGNMLSGLIEYLGIWALFSRFGALESWSLADAGIFFGIGHVAFSLNEMFMREFDVFHRHVRTGSFDRILLRPRSTILQMLGAECQLLRLGKLTLGVIVFVISYEQLGAAWHAAQWLLMALAVLGGALLFAGLSVLQATSCFWTVQSLEIWSSITYGGITTIQYPLDIYQRPLRYLFTYLVPLIAINYWPCSYLLGKGYVPAWLSWLAPFVGMLFFLLSLLVWQIGVKHYHSTGS